MRSTPLSRTTQIPVILSACTLALASADAQPYHADVLLNGIRTLEVEGDISVKQYGAGYGGDLKVVGGAYLATGAEALPSLPAGVTGYYYGPVRVGTSLNVAEYRFSKQGNETTGDFIVPLGEFGDWSGSMVQLDVLTGPADGDSGAANFTLMGKRHGTQGPVVAVSHSSYAGGKGVKIHAFNAHGMTTLFLEFDATSNNPGEVHEHSVIVRASSIGSIDPFNRNVPFAATSPVSLKNSFQTGSIWSGQDSTQTINTDNILLNGNVAVPAGKTFSVGGSPVLTAGSVLPASWTSYALPKGNVSNNAVFGLGGGSATASGAMASGAAALASGYQSLALGESAQATRDASVAIGMLTSATGYSSTAMGFESIASGDGALSLGVGTLADSYGAVALGSFNLGGGTSTGTWQEEDPLLEVGNSFFYNSTPRSNALTILKNGKTTLTNKAWKAQGPGNALADPPPATDGGGTALQVDGHTILNGKVIISVPQGDIPMGLYQ